MSEISAAVIADSICCNRITTMRLTMPKWLVAQFNTHRAFSRNSASSRAIPTSRVRELVQQDPFIPEEWPTAQKGMLGGPPLGPEEALAARSEWIQARDDAVAAHEMLDRMGVAKEVTNRLVEPFMWTSVIVTATDYRGFFKQRLPGHGAQGEMQQLALAMHRAMQASVPQLLHPGEWHLPFAQDDLPTDERICQSVARCARVSYRREALKTDVQADRERHDMLIKEGHWSPLEHQARALPIATPCRNFVGWLQYRQIAEGDQ